MNEILEKMPHKLYDMDILSTGSLNPIRMRLQPGGLAGLCVRTSSKAGLGNRYDEPILTWLLLSGYCQR